MTAKGVVASEQYAVRQKRATKATKATNPRSAIIKRRFRPKPSSTNTMHGEIGFDRQELQHCGSLESPAAKSPTLTNKIHQLFDKKRFVFDREPPAEWDEVYETMKPAFRLVSRWMTDPIFRTFWTALRSGAIERIDKGFFDDPEAAPTYKIELYDLIEPDEREELWEEVPDHFLECAKNHVFRFRPVRHAWAQTRSQTIRHDSDDGPKEEWPFSSATLLHDDFFFLSYTFFTTATKSEQLRFLFFLAVNLGHELAHLMWQKSQAMDMDTESMYSVLDWEPFFFDSPDPHDELGIAWEHFMFGGRIQPLNQCATPFVPDGLAILNLEMVRSSPFMDPECRIAPLLTDWISDQFSENWWERRGRKATQARRPGHPRLGRVRATVNRTTDSDVFLTNTYYQSSDADFIAEHIEGGSDGHRVVQRVEDMWLQTGDVQFVWRRGPSNFWDVAANRLDEEIESTDEGDSEMDEGDVSTDEEALSVKEEDMSKDEDDSPMDQDDWSAEEEDLSADEVE